MKKRRKKKNKKLKKILITILFICLFLIGTFFFDKEKFIELKDGLFNEIKKITNKIQKEVDKNKDGKDKYESIVLNDDLMIFFLDVGQADSILIKSDDKFMLIDAGNNADGEKLVNYFNYLGIKEFEFVFGTHPHEDHIGGLDDIINNFKINNFYMPNKTTTTQTFLDVLNALENKKIKFQTPKENQKLILGKSVIDVISVKEDVTDLNDSSIVLKLTYDNTSFLFTGDLTSNVEKEILNKNLESTLLKVGHHGSKYSNSAYFLKKVNPKYAIISCGLNNEFYHPHQVVLDKLEKMNVEIYRTDLMGTIVVSSDGDKLSIKNVKTNTNGG